MALPKQAAVRPVLLKVLQELGGRARPSEVYPRVTQTIEAIATAWRELAASGVRYTNPEADVSRVVYGGSTVRGALCPVGVRGFESRRSPHCLVRRRSEEA